MSELANKRLLAMKQARSGLHGVYPPRRDARRHHRRHRPASSLAGRQEPTPVALVIESPATRSGRTVYSKSVFETSQRL